LISIDGKGGSGFVSTQPTSGSRETEAQSRVTDEMLQGD